MQSSVTTTPPRTIECPWRRYWLLALLLVGALVGPMVRPAAAQGIVAVVNGDVISASDVDNRRRLFALSTGMPLTKEVLDRLTPQVIKSLVDERLRLQEVQHRKIVVSDKEIAAAISDIEGRNNMTPGALRHRLEAQGVEMRTLIDQIRVQLGWTRVVREELGEKAQITDAEIAEQQALFTARRGETEYRLSEIFIPVDDPAHEADATRFAEAVIAELHSGAPFPVVAAEFSQSQTALSGGDLGWIETDQVDPAIGRIINEMPVGAVSNPVKVAGGFSIVSLRAKRQIGNDPAMMLSIRQVFLPFSAPLNPQAPTDQQRQMVEKAKSIAASTHDCKAMEEANQAGGSGRPSDPGDVRLEAVNPPQLRQMLATLPLNKPTQTPLIAKDGVTVMMVCSREEKNAGVPGREEIANRLLAERAELTSRQLLRDLRRRATIDQRA
jgi:peptidyl-prolyl cis-trans isomerase SurA